MTLNKDVKLRQQIVKNLNLSQFTTQQQNKIISGLMDNAFNRINMTILDLLTEDEKKELEKIAKSRKKGAALKYLSSRIKDFSSLSEEITQETIEDFKGLRVSRQ